MYSCLMNVCFFIKAVCIINQLPDIFSLHCSNGLFCSSKSKPFLLSLLSVLFSYTAYDFINECSLYLYLSLQVINHVVKPSND